MGTDFNYLFSDDMKITVDGNCLEANSSLLNLEEYAEPFQNSDWVHFLPEGQNAGDS